MRSRNFSTVLPQKSLLFVGLGVLAAWATLAIWSLSPFGKLLDHTTIGEGDLSPMVRLPLFLAGWTLMVVAMMLPIELPQIRRIEQAKFTSPGESGVLWRYLLAYISLWVVFGGLLYTGDSALHEAVERSPALESLSWGFSGVILVIAGLYQFTGWKQNCLRAGHRASLPHMDLYDGWSLGWKHGMACLGSCWGLMLVMFAIGRMNLVVMLVVFGLMAAERTRRFKRYAPPLIGLAFLIGGMAGLLGVG